MIRRNETAFTELEKMTNWSVSDVSVIENMNILENIFRYYIPTTEMQFFTDLMKIFYKNELFIEISLHKYLKAVEHQMWVSLFFRIIFVYNFRAINGLKLSPHILLERKLALINYYNENMVFMHAIKLSDVIKNMDQRYV